MMITSMMITVILTGHSEGHQGSDLPLQAVGCDACVVSSVISCDFSEVKLAVPLIHVRR